MRRTGRYCERLRLPTSHFSGSVRSAQIPGARPLPFLIHCAPEFIVRNTFSFTNPLAGRIEDRSEFWRVGHEESFEFIVVARRKEHTRGRSVFGPVVRQVLSDGTPG